MFPDWVGVVWFTSSCVIYADRSQSCDQFQNFKFNPTTNRPFVFGDQMNFRFTLFEKSYLLPPALLRFKWISKLVKISLPNCINFELTKMKIELNIVNLLNSKFWNCKYRCLLNQFNVFCECYIKFLGCGDRFFDFLCSYCPKQSKFTW